MANSSLDALRSEIDLLIHGDAGSRGARRAAVWSVVEWVVSECGDLKTQFALTDTAVEKEVADIRRAAQAMKSALKKSEPLAKWYVGMQRTERLHALLDECPGAPWRGGLMEAMEFLLDALVDGCDRGKENLWPSRNGAAPARRANFLAEKLIDRWVECFDEYPSSARKNSELFGIAQAVAKHLGVSVGEQALLTTLEIKKSWDTAFSRTKENKKSTPPVQKTS